MKTQKPNAELVWKQFTDFLIPQYKLSITDRAVYWHLVRHSRLEGESRLHFSIAWLSRGIRLSASATRRALRRLKSIGAIRIVMRSKAGHTAKVRLPEEIPSWRRLTAASGKPRTVDIEELDFFESRVLRNTIHAREGGECFYCLKRMRLAERCLDHVKPQSKSGKNSYRNMVSCCIECNSQKGEKEALEMLRSLYRERRLSAAELAMRIEALDELAAGKRQPVVDESAARPRRRGRPPIDPGRRRSRKGGVKSHAAGKLLTILPR